ncbi:MAG: hypothetical protein EOO27_19500 [Comamonadaceae bacterium]|nr:MAG: hypothetical protein EOO27_19500 [Comamonadaceae bacterium]
MNTYHCNEVQAQGLRIEREGGAKPQWTCNWVSYNIEGEIAWFQAAGLYSAERFPEGRKRSRFNESEGRTRPFEDFKCLVSRQKGGIHRMSLHNPPEPLWILCELLMRRRTVPPSILAVAWRPGAVEGPRRSDIA